MARKKEDEDEDEDEEASGESQPPPLDEQVFPFLPTASMAN